MTSPLARYAERCRADPAFLGYWLEHAPKHMHPAVTGEQRQALDMCLAFTRHAALDDQLVEVTEVSVMAGIHPAILAIWFYAGVVEVVRNDPGENTI